MRWFALFLLLPGAALAQSPSGGSGAPQVVVTKPGAGSIGQDMSAGLPASITPSFGAGPTYTPSISGYSLRGSFAVNPARTSCWWIVQSTVPLVVVLDDGTGNKVTVATYASGGTQPAQGGADICQGFTGRISYFSTDATAFIAGRQFP